MPHTVRAPVAALGVATAIALSTFGFEARACGGLFCSATQPVNQAAERIVFANNGDGTVTAVIQILYEGPSESFSWLLPIPTVLGEGDIGVASDLAFQRLQAVTNPQFNLMTTIEGQCSDIRPPAPSGGGGSAGPVGTGSMSAGGVVVESAGMIGEFEWTVISLDESLEDPAAAAVAWLEENAYDVSPGSPELLGPYLADGMYLLALKLKKSADTGSIRPITLTYSGERPMIPIQLTAVAANDDLGVLTWVLGEHRAVPFNYYALELNEAKINWLNPSSNYDRVVSEAADEAGGQGFVTEFAGSSDLLEDRIWSTSEEQQWQSFRSTVFNSFSELLQNAIARYGSFSGFWDVVRNQATLPEGVSFEDFRICPNCYADGLSLSPSQFFGALETDVIAPMRDVQTLFDSQPYVTRLYTTLSAAEMTKDPIFAFNADLEDVPNVRTAERVLECGSGLSQFTAPWRIEFADGSVVRGTGVSPTTPWPAPEQPATRRILQIGESGDGRVAEDHSDEILEINDPPPIVVPTAGAGGATGGTPSIVLGGRPSNVTGGVSSAGTAGRAPAAASSGDGGCSIGSNRRAAPTLLAALGLLLLRAGRRRQGSPPWRRL
jgi:hypothetical protein